MSFFKILQIPAVYLLWQKAFRKQKLQPFLEATSSAPFDRILDIGCGPGVNFLSLPSSCTYIGVDISAEYIKHASLRYSSGQFLVGDATQLPLNIGKFDCILINSLCHHLDDQACCAVVSEAIQHLSSDGHIHILEPILPNSFSVAGLLAVMDRGRFIRKEDEWRRLLEPLLTTEHYSTNFLKVLRIKCYHMFYFRGRPR